MDDDLKAVVAELEGHVFEARQSDRPIITLYTDALDTLLSALRQRDEALEPFAKIGGQMMRTPDQRPLTLHGNAVEPDGIPSKGMWTGLTAGDFRKARAILTGSETNAR